MSLCRCLIYEVAKNIALLSVKLLVKLTICLFRVPDSFDADTLIKKDVSRNLICPFVNVLSEYIILFVCIIQHLIYIDQCFCLVNQEREEY